MTRLRTAILGCGGFARRHTQHFVEMSDQVEMVAFCDRNFERAEGYAAEFTDGCATVFTDHHDLFERADLDFVTVCLPPYGHSDEVDCAAAAGVHIFMEKPIALTSEQAWQMVEVAEAAGIVTQVGFMFRFGTAIQRLKALIESGEAGPAGLMSARYFCNSLHGRWWRQREKSGGQLVEQIIHMVDLMRFLMGEAETVYSLQRNLFHQDVPDYTVEDTSGTVFGFENGGIGVIYASNNAVPGQWINDYRVVTEKMMAEFSDANNASFTYTTEDPPRVEAIYSDENIYRLEMLDLFDAIKRGRAAKTPLREGAKSLDLALAAVRSAEDGNVVSVV